MPKILMVAFHFPPMTGSSGQMRAVSFANTLAGLGWNVHVLTASPGAHVQVAEDADGVAADVEVHRALALDTAKHLSLAGRYPDFLAVPDRWWTWAVAGIAKGAAIVRREKPDVIWATYPIATAQIIGCALARLGDVPFVADLRDPMVDDHFPREALKRRAHTRIERTVVARAHRIVFTSPGTLAIYRERYGAAAADRLALIPNGYDERVFEVAAAAARDEKRDGSIVLTHSGSLYPKERDPRPFFRAVADLVAHDPSTMRDVQIVLRATAHDAIYRPELAALGVDKVIRLEPSLPHVAAIVEMLTSDGLLLFQAASCNHQTPAKVYEYRRCGKPILALTDATGDTALALAGAPATLVAPLDDAQAIARHLREHIAQARAVRAAPRPRAQPADTSHSRNARGIALDALLRAVLREGSGS